MGAEVWAVNTLFSCLCTVRPGASFVPRWRPPFVSALAAEDRCHLNGLAVDGGRVRFATALGETDAPGGWRPGKATGGVLIDVPANEVVARGLCMPHSPRVHAGRVWVLDSGTGRVGTVDVAAGRFEAVAAVPGFARGLDFHAGLAFVGLSKVREKSALAGVPVAADPAALKCGVAVVDAAAGNLVAALYFREGVGEIFDVRVVTGVGCPVVSGPHPEADRADPVWVVPPG